MKLKVIRFKKKKYKQCLEINFVHSYTYQMWLVVYSVTVVL